MASIGALATAAAHELGTPLGTIAVVSRELERALAKLETPENTMATWFLSISTSLFLLIFLALGAIILTASGGLVVRAEYIRNLGAKKTMVGA